MLLVLYLRNVCLPQRQRFSIMFSLGEFSFRFSIQLFELIFAYGSTEEIFIDIQVFQQDLMKNYSSVSEFTVPLTKINCSYMHGCVSEVSALVPLNHFSNNANTTMPQSL